MSTRVAVISDTHVGQRISAYPEGLLESLRDFDLIIHAGDHTNVEALEALRSAGEVETVCGNMDEVGVSSQLPGELFFKIERLKIGVIHGWGPPVGLAKEVRKAFYKANLTPDIIIFGHSHLPHDEIIGNVRMLNPGAVSGNLNSNRGSYGILTIDGDSVKWQYIDIDI
ncbi:hypothetical protein DRQ36_09400 [bacterium]|nr:MAG: hypothetical protein DRQ36_09400 [bacterium]